MSRAFLAALPVVDGGFGTIVADPPWPYRAGRKTRIKPRYPTMKLEDMLTLPIGHIAAKRSLLFLWTTPSFTEEAYYLTRAWGFSPKAQIVWIKKSARGRLQIGMGSYVRNAHELVIVGTRGGQTGIVRNVPSVIEAPRTEHSRKPDALLAIAERLAPSPWLELFARRCRPGWFAWGNELGKGAAWAELGRAA